MILFLSMLKHMPVKHHGEMTACVWNNRTYEYNFKLMNRYNFCKDGILNRAKPEGGRKYVHTSKLEVDTL